MNTSRTRTFAVLGLTTLIVLSPVLQAQELPTIPTLEVIRRIDVNVAPRVEQPVLTTPVPATGRTLGNQAEVGLTPRNEQPALATPEAVKDEAFENRVEANRPDRTEQPAANPATGSDFENRNNGNASTSEPKPNDTTNTAAQSTSTNTPSNTATAPTTSNETVPIPANTSVLSYPEAQHYLDELERKRNQQDRYAAEDTANAALDSRQPHLPLYSASVASELRMAETALQALLVQQLSATIASAPMQDANLEPGIGMTALVGLTAAAQNPSRQQPGSGPNVDVRVPRSAVRPEVIPSEEPYTHTTTRRREVALHLDQVRERERETARRLEAAKGAVRTLKKELWVWALERRHWTGALEYPNEVQQAEEAVYEADYQFRKVESRLRVAEQEEAAAQRAHDTAVEARVRAEALDDAAHVMGALLAGELDALPPDGWDPGLPDPPPPDLKPLDEEQAARAARERYWAALHALFYGDASLAEVETAYDDMQLARAAAGWTPPVLAR